MSNLLLIKRVLSGFSAAFAASLLAASLHSALAGSKSVYAESRSAAGADVSLIAAVQIMVNNAAPTATSLGSLSGLSLTIISCYRSICLWDQPSRTWRTTWLDRSRSVQPSLQYVARLVPQAG